MIFYLLDKNEKIIRMLPTNRCDFSVQELNLNGIYILNFDISVKDLWIMENIEYIIHKDIENKENFYMYKIISSGNNKDRLEFKAIYIAMDELESYSYISDKKPKNVKASQAMNIVIANTRWELGEIDDSVVKSLNFYYCSPLKAITKIIDTYNVEINFRLKAKKNRIVKRLIDVKKQVGKFTGKRFFYGSNALEVIKETNNGGIYTKFIPRGRGEEVGDGFGRRIDIKDIVWSKSKGDPIDKPKGQEYIEFEDMTALYGHSDGTPRSTIVPFENIDDPNELIKVAYNYGLVNSRPQISYKSDVERIGSINLGDGVLIIRKDLNIRYVARVYKIIKDLKNPNKTKVELGDNKDISQSKKNMDFQKKLENLDEKLNVTNINFVKKIQEGLTETMYNQESYRYEAIPGDDSGLLSGTWYFNRPIDKNPDKALYLGGGHIAMANKKDSNSNWEFTTIANGDGVIANTIVAGILKGGNVRWNLEDGTFIIGKNANDYSMYWDGGTLHFRNVDIDLKNSKDFSQIKDDLEKKISKDDILEDKEIQEALKGKDGKDGIDGQAGKDGKDGHILTVEVWLEGEFRNYKTKNVKKIIQAKYDGELIDLDSTNTEVYNCYGNGEWSRATLSDFWADWDRQYEYIANKVIVTYKGLKAEAYARLDNIKDGEKGDKGDTGKQGIPGKDGLNGKNGIDGKDGKTGKIGQNLLRNSNVAVSNKLYNTKEWTLCETPITGETMTFTAKIKLEKDDKLMVYNSGGMIHLNWWDEITKSQDYVIYSSTFNWRDKIEYNGKTYEQTNPPTLRLYTYSNGKGENFNNNNVSIEWATLTRGDIPAIEWTPCYADVDDAIKAGKEESEEISRKLIKVESDFKVENNNIKASVSSLSETTERSFVNLKKDMADADVKVETGIKNYVINNYSTKTQTDQKISNEVGSIKTSLGKDINDLNKEVTEAKSMVEQTQRGVSAIVGEVERGLDDKINNLNARVDIQADKIEAKVSKDGFASLVKQEFDSYTVQAKNIDFEGSYVNVKGTFQTLNTSDDVGVEMSYNQVVWKDNRWEGKTFGKITVTKIVGSEYGFSLNFGHYPTGFLSMSYWNNDDKKWYSYMQLDKWNYTGNGGITPIIFHENLNCLRHSIRIGNWELVPQGDTLKIKPYDTKAGYIFQRGGLYRYYASGGKDVKTKID